MPQKRILTSGAIVSLVLLGFPSVAASAENNFNLPSLLQEREPQTLLSSVKNFEARKKVDDRIATQIAEDSETAAKRNQTGLYPNPALQVYANRLALPLVPHEASPDLLVTFRIVEDPQPYADALSTGTIYSKYPPAKPGALVREPLKAAGGVANAAP
ncbi:MAG TPA: hypothetical protein VGS22_14580 [Thermoanaerobaculia bacterium]|jgi:hypothetical protein|nr:hypothetical protein [Thermoanaerobaculia bacterium]